MYRRFALSLAAATTLALAAGQAGAADLNVAGAAAIGEPFEKLAADFTRESGHKVHTIFGPVGGIMNKLKNGEKADVIVLSTAALDELDKAGALVPGTRAEIGRAVAEAVASGTAEIGISFTSELLPKQGVKVVGPLPQSIGLVVTYAAAVASGSQQAEAARALVTYMTRPASRDHFKEAGL